jgi:hypothetical protein
MDVREGATRGSWEYEDFEVGDRVMLRHPKEFYGYFENLQSRKGWDGSFTVKKIRKNIEIVI